MILAFNTIVKMCKVTNFVVFTEAAAAAQQSDDVRSPVLSLAALTVL